MNCEVPPLVIPPTRLSGKSGYGSAYVDGGRDAVCSNDARRGYDLRLGANLAERKRAEQLAALSRKDTCGERDYGIEMALTVPSSKREAATSVCPPRLDKRLQTEFESARQIEFKNFRVDQYLPREARIQLIQQLLQDHAPIVGESPATSSVLSNGFGMMRGSPHASVAHQEKDVLPGLIGVILSPRRAAKVRGVTQRQTGLRSQWAARRRTARRLRKDMPEDHLRYIGRQCIQLPAATLPLGEALSQEALSQASCPGARILAIGARRRTVLPVELRK